MVIEKDSSDGTKPEQLNLIDISVIKTVPIKKVCPRCRQLKYQDDFYTSNRTSDGLTVYCKKCYTQLAREQRNRKSPGWHWRKYGKSWYENNKDHELSRALKKNYGITLDDKKQMLMSQNWKCAICGKNLSLYGKNTTIDHNHITGCIRGVLCHHCNAMLGFARESTSVLSNAIQYLNSHS